MYSCPRCNIRLKKAFLNGSYFWQCPICEGRIVSMEVVRKNVPPELVKELWQLTLSSATTSEAKCPICQRKMTAVCLNVKDRNEEFDICQSCRFVWFDPDEFQNLPPIVHETPAEPSLSLEARKAIALAKIESIKNTHEVEEIVGSTPDYWWEFVLGILGIPVEHNSRSLNNFPIVTWLLASIMVVVAIVSFPNLGTVTQEWALIPNDILRHFGLTFISSFFLHGGIFHLIGNLYFLLVFGDNVEDELGKNKYLMLLALSAFAGDVAHILIDPRSSTPVIGASGGISGLLAYYCLKFPDAKIGFIWWFRWYRIPVRWMFLFWIAGQLIGVVKQVSGFGEVSSLAHLGGAIVGLTYWWAMTEEKMVQGTA